MNEHYSRQALIDWFHRTSGVNGQPTPDEVNTTCPLCGSDKLYFNVRKQVGVCHSAGCEWHAKVFLTDLIEVFGFSPSQHGEWEDAPEGVLQEVRLPGYPVLLKAAGRQLLTYSEIALEYLRGRGIDDQLILNWGLTCDGERIFVPIKDSAGILRNYNSRLLPGYEGKKYLYCVGAKTSHYILGWQESRDWTDLALVENTFVSLAYRSRMHCSTTFGSNVSDLQADTIAESGIKRVAILWDENAEAGADRAIKKLGDRGVRAAYWKIIGQPDDYPIEWVEEKCEEVKQAAGSGKKWLDFRNLGHERSANGIIY